MFPATSTIETGLLTLAWVLAEGILQKDQIVSTKPLYNYVDLGLMGIKNIDLPEKVSAVLRLSVPV